MLGILNKIIEIRMHTENEAEQAAKRTNERAEWLGQNYMKCQCFYDGLQNTKVMLAPATALQAHASHTIIICNDSPAIFCFPSLSLSLLVKSFAMIILLWKCARAFVFI